MRYLSRIKPPERGITWLEMAEATMALLQALRNIENRRPTLAWVVGQGSVVGRLQVLGREDGGRLDAKRVA